MKEAIIKEPLIFVDYCFEDVLLLEKIYYKKINTHNLLLKNTFNLSNEFLISEDEFPMTNGSLVHKSFIFVLMDYVKKNCEYEKFILAVHKLGILNTEHPSYRDHIIHYKVMYSNIPQAVETLKKRSRGPLDDTFFNYEVFEFTAFNCASIPYFLTFDKKTT